MPTRIPQKIFQVVVWGASGFTGKLVCQHLAAQPEIRWAMAGRNKAKLESVRQELAQLHKHCQDVPILLADGNNQQSLADMAAPAQVVVTTVGPYSKHTGENLVAACIESNTHYCDLTAEPTFIKRMQEKYDEIAKQKGVKIVHCCGFDSIPSDIGTLFVVDYCRTKLGKSCAEVHVAVGDTKGGVSGGTLDTAFWLAEHEPSKEQRAMSKDEYYLVRDRTKVGSDKPPSKFPTWDPLLSTWTAPWVMEGMNAKVVHLSNALASTPYGPNFRYSERVETKSVLLAMLISTVMFVGGILIRIPFTRAILHRLLPRPGQGPSLKSMRGGHWTMHFAAKTHETYGQEPTIVKATVQDLHRDGGYWGTSRMLLEAGLTLALHQAELEAAGLPKGGVLTPASAMGLVLAKRLQDAAITFTIHHN